MMMMIIISYKLCQFALGTEWKEEEKEKEMKGKYVKICMVRISVRVIVAIVFVVS